MPGKVLGTGHKIMIMQTRSLIPQRQKKKVNKISERISKCNTLQNNKLLGVGGRSTL